MNPFRWCLTFFNLVLRARVPEKRSLKNGTVRSRAERNLHNHERLDNDLPHTLSHYSTSRLSVIQPVGYGVQNVPPPWSHLNGLWVT
jgi:hypothetical protein